MTVASIKRPPLRYHGGKWRLAKWIISHFPAHCIYTEPYGGGASVLLRKPRTYSEVYNDLNEEVVTFFRVLRDAEKAAELERRVRLTPFSRIEFESSYADATDEVDKARHLLVRSHMGFGSGSYLPSHRTGFRSNANRSGTTPAHDWKNYPDQIKQFTERLRGVVIECRDAMDVMRQHDSPDTLHYLDPPYVHSERNSHSDVYAYEMTDRDHEQLAAFVRELEGMVVLSGYASELYEDLYHDWTQVSCSTIKSSNNASVPATECLWLSPAAARRGHRTLFT